MFLTKYSLKMFIILVITHSSNAIIPNNTSTNSHRQQQPQNSWFQQMGFLRRLIKECENSSVSNISVTWQCVKMRSLNIVVDMTKRQMISLGPGVRFVQRSDIKKNQVILDINENEFWERKDLQYLTWFDRLILSLTQLLSTHTLEINLKDLTEAYLDNIKENDPLVSTNADPVGTARHRRYRFNLMITMMFGVTALGAVLIPMGFQMLSIVSGKALLLAKMALLLASINGLKRVANSGVHYGLYHVPGEHYGHYYDRGDLHHPRNVQNLIPVPGQPIVADLAV